MQEDAIECGGVRDIQAACCAFLHFSRQQLPNAGNGAVQNKLSAVDHSVQQRSPADPRLMAAHGGTTTLAQAEGDPGCNARKQCFGTPLRPCENNGKNSENDGNNTSLCSNKGVVCVQREKTQAVMQCIEAQTAMSMRVPQRTAR